MVCKFAYVDYSIQNGNIKSIKNTNIAYVMSHIITIKNNDYLIFEDSNDTLLMAMIKKFNLVNLKIILKTTSLLAFS